MLNRIWRALRIETWGPYFVIGALWFIGATLIEVERLRDRATYLKEYRHECSERTRGVEVAVEHHFRTTYEHLRTIARLPGVRRIGRESTGVEFRGGGTALDGDSKRAIQEIYNNLAMSVQFSEVYIVPRDFDPDRKDPRTDKGEEPLITFDDLIIGKTRKSSATAAAATLDDDESHHDDHDAEAEEIEIFEYRLMAAQIAHLIERFPTEDSFEGLDYPSMTGPEVVTCDNRRFDPLAPNDKDRSGIVYSVPFYRDDGSFGGIVAGVFLTHALRDLLPDGNSLIVNTKHDVVVMPRVRGPYEDARDHWSVGAVDPRKFYSECITTSVADSEAEWKVWSAVDDGEYWNRGDVQQSIHTATASHIGLVIACTAIAALFFLLRRHQRRLAAQNSDLETRVKERTAELLEVSRRAGMAEIAGEILHNIGNVLTGANVAVRMLDDRLRKSKAPALLKTVELLHQHEDDLGSFLTTDERGRKIPEFLDGLASQIGDEQKFAVGEVQKITDSVAHMMEILEDQRSLASAKRPRERIRVRDLVDRAATLVQGSAKRHGIVLTVENTFECEVLVDRSKCLQVLVNLLTNAKDACDSFRAPGERAIKIATKKCEGYVDISVTDNGCGIAPDVLSKLFAPRFTTKQNGRGIGLHYSANAATELGGSIDAKSEGPGHGATFTLRLPIQSVPVYAR